MPTRLAHFAHWAHIPHSWAPSNARNALPAHQQWGKALHRKRNAFVKNKFKCKKCQNFQQNAHPASILPRAWRLAMAVRPAHSSRLLAKWNA